MAIPKIPPAFPVPVLPQVFDTSLSYYELLCKLTEQINTVIAQVNTNTANIEIINASLEGIQQTVTDMQDAITELQSQVGNVPEEIAQISADLAAERQARIDGDTSLAGQISAWSVKMVTEYPSFEDLEADYLIGVTFQKVTQEEFDALPELVANRVYIVTDGGNVVLRTANGEQIAQTATTASGLFSPAYAGTLNFVSGVYTPNESEGES